VYLSCCSTSWRKDRRTGALRSQKAAGEALVEMPQPRTMQLPRKDVNQEQWLRSLVVKLQLKVRGPGRQSTKRISTIMAPAGWASGTLQDISVLGLVARLEVRKAPPVGGSALRGRLPLARARGELCRPGLFHSRHRCLCRSLMLSDSEEEVWAPQDVRPLEIQIPDRLYLVFPKS
jgi:hypothetical protein